MHKGLSGSKFMLLLMVWWLIVQVIFDGVRTFLYSANGLDISTLLASPWLIIGNQLVIFILPLALWLFYKEESFKSNMPNWKLGGTNIVLIVLLSFLLQPAMMLLSMASSLFFYNPVSGAISESIRYPFLLIMVAFAVTPAVCEEVVFRGYIQSKYRDRPIAKAALLNGLFFAIMHVHLQQFAYAFVMGVIFAYMVHYTRSIWAGILPHFIINATQATWGRLAFAAEVAEDAQELQVAELFIVLIVIVLVLAPAIILLFRSFFNHNRWRITDNDPRRQAKVEVLSADDSYDITPQNYPQAVSRFRIDPYAFAVVAIFIIIQLLRLF